MPIVLHESEPWSLVSKQTVVLEPEAKHVIRGKVMSDNMRDSPNLVCVERAVTNSGYLCSSCFGLHMISQWRAT